MPLWGRIVFCALGLLSIGTGITIFLQNVRVHRWSTTKGKILESAVTGFDEDFVAIKYQYKVKGVTYIGDRFNVSKGSVGNAPEVVKRYQPGGIVDVLYNPENPKECALVRDHPAVSILMVLVGLGFFLFGIFASF